MRGEVSVGIGTRIGSVGVLDRFGKRHAIGGDDGAALDIGGAHDRVVVAGHALDVLGLEHLEIGEIANEDGK